MHYLKPEVEKYSEQVVTRKEKGCRSSTYHKSEGNKYLL